ncbi:SHOCT domain-containing protein [Salipiger pacificus]|nr:SHOCT domain-containing protein [Alloyangia pacifica]MCA0943893.1 SHOCT domain-containing protein [Alloyangia pacifica]
MKRLLFTTMLLATPAMADLEGDGHMMNWGYGHGVTMIFGPILWLIVLGVVVVGVVWFVRKNELGGASKGHQAALAELDMRLARGEIEPEEYAARKKLLAG